MVFCLGEKVQFCKDFGVDEVIDYKQINVIVEFVKQGVDKVLIVDNVGNLLIDLY